MQAKHKRILALVAVTTCVCLLLAEGLSRLRYADRYRKDFTFHSNIRHDSVLGWSGIPGAHTVDAFGQVHDINADGLRDDDWADMLAAIVPGRTRTILLLGDSLTYGLCIAKDERLGEQLAALYAADGVSAQVFNTAMPGYGTDQQYLALLRHIDRVKPAAVVLYFCANDFGDAALPYDHRDPRRRCYKPWFDDQGRLALNSPVPLRFSQRVKNTWLDRLRLKYLVDDAQYLVDDLRYRLAGVGENRRIYDGSGPPANMDQITIDPRYEDLYQANKKRVFTLMAMIRDVCRTANARFVVLANHGRTTAHERELFDTLASLGIETASTFALDRTPFDLTPFAYVQGDGHPNFLQNLVNATVLHNALENANLPVTPGLVPWYDTLPREIDFGRADIGKYLFGAWHASETTGRWFDRNARCLLRGNGQGTPQRLVLDFSSARAADLNVQIDSADNTLRVPGPGVYRATLPLDKASLHALTFASDAFVGDDLSHNGDTRSLSFYMVSARVEPAAHDAEPAELTRAP